AWRPRLRRRRRPTSWRPMPPWWWARRQWWRRRQWWWLRCCRCCRLRTRRRPARRRPRRGSPPVDGGAFVVLPWVPVLNYSVDLVASYQWPTTRWERKPKNQNTAMPRAAARITDPYIWGYARLAR